MKSYKTLEGTCIRILCPKRLADAGKDFTPELMQAIFTSSEKLIVEHDPAALKDKAEREKMQSIVQQAMQEVIGVPSGDGKIDLQEIIQTTLRQQSEQATSEPPRTSWGFVPPIPPPPPQGGMCPQDYGKSFPHQKAFSLTPIACRIACPTASDYG